MKTEFKKLTTKTMKTITITTTTTMTMTMTMKMMMMMTMKMMMIRIFQIVIVGGAVASWLVGLTPE